MGPGVGSDQDVLTLEPPLQHKKRVDGPPTSLSTDYFRMPSNAGEYILLGQQDKFSHNVMYQAKQAIPGANYKNKENIDNVLPPAKHLKMQKQIKCSTKERHPTAIRSFQYLQDIQTPSSPLPAPRGNMENNKIKESMADKDLRDVLGNKRTIVKPEKPIHQSSQSEQKKEEANMKADQNSGVNEINTNTDLRDPLRESKSKEQASQATEKRQKKQEMSHMNKVVQTDMRKGMTVSSSEAPADYALRYKAHITPSRLGQNVSEYQKQFQWKENIKSSPLLNAEEVVFKSQTDLGPYKRDNVPKISEYKHQFHPWQAESHLSDKNLNYNNNINNNKNNNSIKAEKKQKPRAKRSRSFDAVPRHDEFIDEEKNDAEVTASDPEELKSKLTKLHGKIRNITSEYRANFRSPTSYRYECGVWRGVCPPQIIHHIARDEATLNINANNNNEDNNKAEAPSVSNWFSEVIELRRRAEEYRKRAQGTHFSREHLVQLLAKHNDCWDVQANAPSTIEALNLEYPTDRARVIEKRLQSHIGPERNVMSNNSETEHELETSEQGEMTIKRKDVKQGQERKSRKMAWLEEHKETIAQQKRRLEEERARLEHDLDDTDAVTDEQMEGRIPTPELQQNASVIRRHHLDLTTPSVGGAILTCPPSKYNKMIVSPPTGGSYVTTSDDYPAKSLLKTYNMDSLRTMPIYGKPSADTHLLRNDCTDSDTPLTTQSVKCPLPSGRNEDKENQGQPIEKSKRRNKNKRSSLTAVPEGYGRTYNVSRPIPSLANIEQKDDDVMSVSLMSVASSNSLASQVLERTRKRQKFWNKNDNDFL